MRQILSAMAVLASVACQSAVSPDEMTWLAVTNGSQARFQSAEGHAAMAENDAEYRALWSNLIGAGEPPAVDFTRDTAVVLIASQKPSGGYVISVRGVSRSDNALVVDAPVTAPPEGAMTIQVLTTPFIVIAVPRSDAKTVEWKR